MTYSRSQPVSPLLRPELYASLPIAEPRIGVAAPRRMPTVNEQPEVLGGGPSRDEVEPVAEAPEGADAQIDGSGRTSADSAGDEEQPRPSMAGFTRVIDVMVPSFGPKRDFAALFPKIELPDLSVVLR